jgi:uroporphyrinogen decarboxylase
MIPRERIKAAFNHEETDRVPIHDRPWEATVERWHKEGLPEDVNPAEYFNYEIVCFDADTSPRFPAKVIEETDEYITHSTAYGGLVRDHRDYSTPYEVIDYPCKSREDWEAIKERLVADKSRVDWEGEWMSGTAADERERESVLETGRSEWRRGLPGCETAREQGMFTCFSSEVGFDSALNYVAMERLLIAVATEPEWVRDIYETDADMVIEMYEIMKAGGFEFDGAFLYCDLGYRNGLFFSPRHYDEQLRPTFRRLLDHFNGDGVSIILHNCGDVRDLIPRFIEDGLTCLQPLEVKAGMDLILLKQEFGDKLSFMGGIDVRAMADPDPAVIEEEIRSKLLAAKVGGGYVYHSDHSVPKDVSFDRYSRILKLVKEYGAY